MCIPFVAPGIDAVRARGVEKSREFYCFYVSCWRVAPGQPSERLEVEWARHFYFGKHKFWRAGMVGASAPTSVT